MMMNNVVKSSLLSSLLCEFNEAVHSDIVNQLCRKKCTDFTRKRNMNFYSLIYYFIFRNKKTTNSELTWFYSSICEFEKRISKQALNKAVRKMNPNVFIYLIHIFSKIYYSSQLPKDYRGYYLIAEDGTYVEIPYNVYNAYDFQFCLGKHVHDIFDVKKIQSKAGGLYDVMNGLFVDFSMKPAPYSETPLAFEHLYRTQKIFEGKKVIYLADRYYGSAEIISHLEYLNYNYIIRGKKYFYKKQVALMKSDDEWIRIRVIKKIFKYINQKGEECKEELIYFTNLDSQQFSTEEILQLYSMRWDIEVSYKTLKTTLELERFISEDGDAARNCVYGKVLFHNIAGIIRKELNKKISRDTTDGKQYVTNITQLQEMVYETNFLYSIINGKKTQIKQKIENIVKMINKIKVPVRPNRHYKRWGRVIVNPPSYRFRLDGRNNPKVKSFKHVLITVAP